MIRIWRFGCGCGNWREPGAVRVSAPDGAAQTGRLGGERQAYLPAVYLGRVGGADQSAQEDCAAHAQPALKAMRLNEKWSMDFVAARLLDGRWLRVLTVVFEDV